MQTILPSDDVLPELLTAARALAQSNESLAKAKKAIDGAKACLAKWLKEARGIDLATLSIGTRVHIKGVVLIKISSMQKLDADKLQLERPEIYNAFYGPIPVKYFDPEV